MNKNGWWLLVITLLISSADGGRLPIPRPTPVDPVDPPPITEAGFRVLFVWETTDYETYTKAQQAALKWDDKSIDEYTRDKCAKVNGHPERRSVDDDLDMAEDTTAMRDMRAKVTGTERPWVVVSNGKAGYNGPMPPDKILDLLKKYGG